MINDGFGNEISESELVANYHNWSHAVAGAMVNASSSLYDDLVQEALIEVWKVAQRKPEGVSATYVAKAAKYRMLGIVQGKQMTGADPTPGPKFRPAEHDVDWQDEATTDTFQSLLVAADALAAVEWAYHQGEIVQALNALPERDRRYVVARFWEGKTDTEIAAETGVSNKSLGIRWKRTVVPRLVAQLHHLART